MEVAGLPGADLVQQGLEDLARAGRIRELMTALEPSLYRYPAIDAPTFRRAVERERANP